MKVLITGISGFLGYHFTKELVAKGYYVVGVDKRPIPDSHLNVLSTKAFYPSSYVPQEFTQTDVRDLEYVDLMDIDYVIHLAFITNIPNSVRHPEKTTHDNICMTMHLLEKCKEAGVKKVIFPSTASLYSNNPTPWTEDMSPDPIEPYSWQKLSLEYACKLYDNCIIVRFFQIFGEFQRKDTALYAFLRAKEKGRSITLTKTMAQSSFRSGQRDFIYAGDVAKAIVLLLEKGKIGEIYNIASGQVNTMEEVANALKCDVKWIPRREYEVERHHGDISKIKKLGWSPKINVIDWLKQYAK